jgi:hypothetical protein
MDENLINSYQEEIKRIIQNTGNENLIESIKKVIERYAHIDAELSTNLTKDAIEYIAATAEETKNLNLVMLSIECFLLEDIEKILRKYKKNKLNVTEIFSDIGAFIHRKVVVENKKENLIKYLNWLNNGFISKFLNFVSEFPNSRIAPLQQNVFHILDVRSLDLDVFNEHAMKIYRKKIPIEKKIELILFLSLLLSTNSTNKEKCLDAVFSGDLKKLKKLVEEDLNLTLPNKYSLACGISFLNDMSKDPNLKLIHEKTVEYRGSERWFKNDETIRSVTELLEKNGFNSNIFVNSGKIISQKKSNTGFSENWIDVFKHIVIKIIGSKNNEMLPKISIPNHSPGSLFSKIRDEYKKAIEGDKEAGKNILFYFSTLIRDSYRNRKMPISVSNILYEIESLVHMINSGIVTNYKGSKLTAKVWKRRVPQDLYHTNMLWCCWFLPQNENNEIPLIFLDPKTTILQFYAQGIENPVGVAFLYAGKVEDENCVFVDTWEGGPFSYISLGQEKTHEFVLKSLINFTKKVGARKLLIYAHPKYTRAKEFGNFLRDKEFKIENVFFQAIDVEDVVLGKYSQTFKHHTTDAFGKNSLLKGNVDVFVFKC